jgi:hypothetical protein
LERLSSRSDTEGTLRFQTPVKAQGSRGTCTFFSTVGVLESRLIARRGFVAETDLSEQWLAYLVLRNKSKDGSNSNLNFRTLTDYGMLEEAEMPYESVSLRKNPQAPLAVERCAEVPEELRKSCLVSHYDPRLLETPNSWMSQLLSRAVKFRDGFLRPQIESGKADFKVRKTSEIKSLLKQGIPLTFGTDFYYGAWNSGKADELGIGRNLEHWNKGIVGYPAEGSKDREISSKKSSGHSVIVVGYDDDVVVETPVVMTDGSMKTFRYQGVYYIKNSWGTEGFGSKFELDGVPHPGYGMITQKYAHEMGGFFRLF